MTETTRVFDFEGKEYLVKKPGFKEITESTKVYNRTFKDAIQSGALIRERLDDVLREQGLWSDEKEMEYQTLRREILEYELKLKKGGIKLSEGEDIAKHIRKHRLRIVELLTSRSNLDSNTAEGQADNMRFNYLVSCSLVYNDTGKRYFSSLEDYLERADDPISEKAARELYYLMYDQNSDAEKELTENKFLVRFKFMNEDLQWINKDGRLVDESGRLIDEEGRFIDEDGNFVDMDGNALTEDGEYDIEEQPFLDEAGQPITE